ncbi:endonuclease/exonuclease/phosphatase family protein [Aspergillus heteromorphus CBS 117.55]|uniref:Endonuclease/exonuclease/phosphatase family protein n=1 Tax=Aspergillus heteromorphus CBS 117.55 TaxID=1448321 RepID=A0A317VAY4_9EURO|nr:endonuclease/exonuclease/phosphatase family protein [Aspergillus heteromorphus CBS 117.55]PWY69080.1 endonuclease/exonuclease/phosphatase family protein [Aspergillus heteromorphus CBS 117.55]
MRVFTCLGAVALLVQTGLAVTISEINGDRYISPYKGEHVSGLKGLVTAKGKSGFYLRSTDVSSSSSSSSSSNSHTSNSVYVYGSQGVSKVAVGDIVTLSGKVSEYRSSSSYVYSTEIESPSDINVLSSGNTVTPIVIGQDGRNPPTEQYSSLDNGDVFSLPGDSSQLSNANPVLRPTDFGMDFWQSLSGELATLTGLVSISKADSYGDTWVTGNWPVTGRNGRGGLTMRAKDANPESIVIGSPLDGTKNPTNRKLGDTLEDITGIITQAYGYYALLPLTAIKQTGSNSTEATATTLVSDGTCRAITVGDYNVDNFSPDTTRMSGIAEHIAKYMNSPTVVFLQEIQDNSGSKDDGVVSASLTLSRLASAIQAQGGVAYNYTDIDPINDTNGGEHGGNIRVAYLYDPSVVRLRDYSPGSSTDATQVLSGGALSHNPGLIDPGNEAWDDSRKPLVAEWETLDGQNSFYTINVHFTSKYDSTGLEGDERPPVNGWVENRVEQARIVAKFVTALLAEKSEAKILTGGDFNEYAFVEPLEVFASESKLLDLEEVTGIPATERYTYLYNQNCESLDHMYVSSALAAGAQMEHIHVNTWVSRADELSDHDPTVALFDVCQ